MNGETKGIKVDLKLAMDQAQDIMDATRSLDNLTDAIVDKYEDLYSKSSDSVRKFLDKITEDTKSTQKVIDNINAGKNLLGIDPRETKKALDETSKVAVNSLKNLQRYIDDNKLNLANQLGLDANSPEFKQAINDGVKAYTQYMQEVGRGVKNVADQFGGPTKGAGSGSGSDIGHQFGLYFLSNLIGSSLSNLLQAYEIAPIGVEAGKYQRTQTAFDLRSAPGMYQAKQMMEIQNMLADAELKAMQTRSMYTTAGQLGGATLGMLLGSTVPGIGTVAGGFVGSQLGELIGGTYGGVTSEEDKAKVIRETAQKQAQMMRNLQTFQLMEQYAQSFQNYDIARGLFSARFGNQSVGGSGIGYNMAELQNLAYGQGRVSGFFNQGTFEDQLNFSRGFGYKPEEIFQASFSSRYTGQQVNSNELMARQNLANQTGLGGRLPELIQSMNQLTVSMGQLTGRVDENNIMKFSYLPSMLFGNDSPYGRLPDYGMNMLQRLNSAMVPEMGSVQSVELLRSYAEGEQRRGNNTTLFDLVGRMQQGVFGENNLQDLLTTALTKSGGNQNMFKAYLNAMTGLNYKQVGMIQEQLDKYDGATPEEKISNWAKDWEKNMEDLKDPAEKTSEYLRTLAEEHTPKSLQYLETISNEMIKMGANTLDKVMAVQLETIKMHAEMFKDAVKMNEVVRDIINSLNQQKTNPDNLQYGPPKKQDEQQYMVIPLPGGQFTVVPMGQTNEDMSNFFNKLGEGITNVIGSVFDNILGGSDLRYPNKVK